MSRGLGLFASAVVGMLVCGCPLAGYARVVARLAAASGERQYRKVDTEARRAVCVQTDEPRDLSVESPSRWLVFGVALEPPDDVREPVVFRVEEKIDGANAGGERWTGVFEERLKGGAPGWRDHVVDLGRKAKRALRFRILEARRGVQTCWGSVAVLDEPVESSPNVVLLSLDTLGADYLGAYGGPGDVSPHMDAFLAQAYWFRRAYAQYPSTLVSHASLFTGQYPIHHGRRRGQWGHMNSLVKSLARHGYYTAAFTEDAYVGSAFGYANGFDRYDDGPHSSGKAHATTPERDASVTFGKAESWLGEFERRSPFFLFVHTYKVHTPYGPLDDQATRVANAITPDDSRMLDPIKWSLRIVARNRGLLRIDSHDIRRLRALYLGEIDMLDRVVDAFMRRLHELGLAENTLVILTADHGEQFGERGKLGHGQTLHNRLLHVPLGFRWPARVRSDNSKDVVQLVDVLPTVFGLLGLEIPHDVDGRDLAPLVLGSVSHLDPRPAFAELHLRDEKCPASADERCWRSRYAVQTSRYKLISSPQQHDDRLYDLERNPLETKNVGAEHPNELKRLQAILEDYLESPARGRRGVGAARTPHVDPNTQERLRALGYLD